MNVLSYELDHKRERQEALRSFIVFGDILKVVPKVVLAPVSALRTQSVVNV